ncbi:nicotinate phosphoribosyltransferase [Lacticaseibacillus suilingensis]|uniref:Nicotinate phosphoribosyltransferase n=1 Tax=Lacticaseibacillus suilingensis TaxID=2799577 RepID=A0ABW4BDF7_9LACO|nr:nicotinate phosphoribosyltransferase [Lacticaseibacillus suilingensis]
MRNLSMLTDLYEFSMANGFQRNLPHTRGIFDIFYRDVPDHGSFVIAAGLAQVVQVLRDFHFDAADVAYLRSLNLYDDAFLTMLADFQLDCTISAVPEGLPVFPREPLVTIEGPLAQAQLLETVLLNILNHQSLIATKARRITFAAQGRPIMEFGARRAQGPDSALYGTRAAVIGGAVSTSNVLAAQQFGIPAAGTMAHSWIEAFPSELAAFQAWAQQYPDNSALLVDTYDVLRSGVPNAITVFKALKAAGHQPVGIRIDSGDIAYLSKQARKQLDAAGLPEVKITASNALDETVIPALLAEGAPLDNFGIGEKMITSASAPVLSGVYKLAATRTNGQLKPKIKVSASVEKTTLPGIKQIYRLYRPGTHEAFADVMALADETLQTPLAVVDSNPLQTHKYLALTAFTAVPLQQSINLAQAPLEDVFAIQKFAQTKLAELPAETKRLVNPASYPVYVTQQLDALQHQLIDAFKQQVN